VIIIGAQKSGSSALFSHLIRHPAAVPFMAKEAHYFDRDYTFEKGVRHYMSSTLDPLKLLHARAAATPEAPMPSLVELHKQDTPEASLAQVALPPTYLGFQQSQALGTALESTFTLETTPAYVLDSRAAVKIASLLPHAKLLLILRNPVDRAYSEWNMKLRRVQGQFHASNTAHLQQVYAGIVRPCFKHPNKEHSYNRTAPHTPLSPAAREGKTAQPGDRPSGTAVYRCLLKHLPKDEAVKRLMRPASTLRSVVAPCIVKGTHQPWAKRTVNQALPDYRNERPRGIPVPQDAGTQFAERMQVLAEALPAAVQAAGAGGSRDLQADQEGGLRPEGPATRLVGKLAQAAHWTARQLGAVALGAARGVGGGGSHHHSPWTPPPGAQLEDEHALDEAERLKRLLARLPDKTSLPPLDVVKRCLSPPLVRPERVPPVTSLGVEADAITQYCLRSDGSVRWGEAGCWANGLTSNIVNEYVARGLYLPQLKLFHSVFGKDRVMVLSDAELLDDAGRGATLAKVFAFLGLPPLQADQLSDVADAEATQAAFTHAFPDFERTGWQAKSKYAPLTEGVRRKLQDLFRPINAQLYSYLGRDLGWEEAAPAS